MSKKSLQMKRKRRSKRRVLSATNIAELPNIELASDDGRRVVNRAAEQQNLIAMAFTETVQTRARRHNMSIPTAKSQLAGTELGRLADACKLFPGNMGDYNVKRQNQSLYEAGNHFAEVYHNWHTKKGIPSPNPSAANMHRVPGKDGDTDNPDATQAAIRAYESLLVPIMVQKEGKTTYELLKRLCVEDVSTERWNGYMFLLLKNGLQAVQAHTRGL